MIIFNNISLNSVANAKIEDILVSPIQYEPVAKPRAIRGGSDFVRNRCGERTVTIMFALPVENQVQRQKALMAISEWAKTDQEYRLELPGHPDLYLMAVCVKKPDPSLRQWWESGLQLVFRCVNNPYWNSKAEKSAACGSDFMVMGNAQPLMRIERTLSAQASNQSYALNGNTMTFSTVPAGKLVIDLEEQTAVVGTTDIMQYYVPTSKFLIPRTGAQNVTGTGTVYYRERWE